MTTYMQLNNSGHLVLFPPSLSAPPQRIWAREVKSPIPKIAPLPTHFFVVHDASYLASTYQAGGGCAVVNAMTGDYHLHEVDVPIFVDNSYQAEVYTAWAILCGSGSVLWGSTPAAGHLPTQNLIFRRFRRTTHTIAHKFHSCWTSVGP